MKLDKERIMNNRKKDVERDELAFEKWVIMVKDYEKQQKKDPKIFIRQFMAQGYYEAYDIARSYAERSKLEIVWFKEKRLCPEYYSKYFPWLEYFCTYCNRKFNDKDPLTCNIKGCQAILCSKNCINNHIQLKHKEFIE